LTLGFSRAELRSMPLPSEQPSRSERFNWVIVLVFVAAIGSCGLVALPVAVYGYRNYVTRARVAETRQIMGALAAGIAECASQSPAARAPLPPTALPVPLALASVSGRRYHSTPSDWQDEAYRCARFALGSAQSSQLQWIRKSDAEGYVHAIVDVDGDMTPDWILEQTVQCGADGRCRAGEPSERR
jgi:hypothetical protein